MLGEKLFKQIIDFELRGLDSLALYALLQLQNKNLNAYLPVDYYLLLKYRRRQCTLLLPTWAKLLAKYIPKTKGLKLCIVLKLDVKERLNNLIFSIDF